MVIVPLLFILSLTKINEVIVLGSEASTEGEIRKILTQEPKFIVRQKNIWYLSNKPQAKFLLDNTLHQNYELVKQIQGKQIYRRIN